MIYSQKYIQTNHQCQFKQIQSPEWLLYYPLLSSSSNKKQKNNDTKANANTDVDNNRKKKRMEKLSDPKLVEIILNLPVPIHSHLFTSMTEKKKK